MCISINYSFVKIIQSQEMQSDYRKLLIKVDKVINKLRAELYQAQCKLGLAEQR